MHAKACMAVLSVVIACAFMAGCAPAPTGRPTDAQTTLPARSPSAISTPRVLPTRLLALLSGQLIRVDGCFRVDTEQGSVLIGWTPVFDVRREQDAIHITDTLTGERADWHVGDRVQVGGAYPSQMDPEFRHGQPEDCPGPYFVMHTF